MKFNVDYKLGNHMLYFENELFKCFNEYEIVQIKIKKIINYKSVFYFILINCFLITIIEIICNLKIFLIILTFTISVLFYFQIFNKNTFHIEVIFISDKFSFESSNDEVFYHFNLLKNFIEENNLNDEYNTNKSY